MCLTPIRIKNPRYEGIPPDQWYSLYPEFKPNLGVLPLDYWLDVPCGKCHECATSKRASWVFRLKQEFSENPEALFVTLTFDDDSYSRFFPDNVFHNKPLSLFLDRFRKKYGKQVRHFFIGEFGKETKRFHYHGIFFGISYIDINQLTSLWSYGYAWLGYCNEKTINYITKYIVKANDFKEKIPRIMASPGIGAGFIDSDDGRYYLNRDDPSVVINTSRTPIPIPRYIRNKALSDKTRRSLLRKYLLESPPVEYIRGEEYLKNTAAAAVARHEKIANRKTQGFHVPGKSKEKTILTKTPYYAIDSNTSKL